MGGLLPLSLDGMTAQSQHYNLTCVAYGNGAAFNSTATLAYLPRLPSIHLNLGPDHRVGAVMHHQDELHPGCHFGCRLRYHRVGCDLDVYFAATCAWV